MSRSEAHGQDFDHSAFDGRGNGEHGVGGQDYGGHIRDYMARDGLRELASRDFGTQEYGSTTFYNSSYNSSSPPPPFTTDRRQLTSNVIPSSGFPSFVAPRMLNSAQGISVGTGGGWNSKPPQAFSGPPNVGRPAGEGSGPLPSQVQPPVMSSLVFNQQHRPSPSRGLPDLYSSPLLPNNPSYPDRDNRDTFFNQQRSHPQQSSSPLSVQLPPAQPQSLPSPSAVTPSPRTTLWWGELELWMDEEYAKQVCSLMGWDPISIKVPRPAPDPITGQQANNPGYCFLTFPTQAQAASVLSQVNNSTSSLIMPNSSKPFSLNWASSVPSASVPSSMPGQTISIPGVQNPQYPKEYSIFVGDLAPEVSNSDLVAVFRNPVLGLRNDREPRFIRPFLSCKSAKIMLDPVTGVSRGYGFVRYASLSVYALVPPLTSGDRFTDEADQQRALIEMHGLYCLSRPSMPIVPLVTNHNTDYMRHSAHISGNCQV